MTLSAPVRESSLPLPLVRRGKVRDVYAIGDDHLLLVATDRVSAFDVVMDEPIPYKGAVLTQLSAWWLRKLESRFGSDLPHHMVSADVQDIVTHAPSLDAYRAMLAGRSMLCLRTEVIPVECVVRGYLAGSAWKEYSSHGTLAGEALPVGLLKSSPLVPPLFSPATKAESGHDENITVAAVVQQLGAARADALERCSRAIYEFGRETAAPRGIIVADTKFEFGVRNGQLMLIDEVLTPDSSRFWPADQYTPGHSQPSFDKQPLRDWLDAERRAGRWNGDAPGPTLPDEVVQATSARYLDAFARITGAPLDLAALGVSAAA